MTSATAAVPFAPSARRSSARRATSRLGLFNLVLLALAAALFAAYIVSYVSLYRSATARDRAEVAAASAASEVRVLEARVVAAGKALDHGAAATIGLVEVVPRYASAAAAPAVVGFNLR